MRLTNTFAADRDAPRCVRQWAGPALSAYDVPPQRLSDALVLVSELVTNALLHATGPLCVSLERIDDGVHLEVHDKGPRHQVRCALGHDTTPDRVPPSIFVSTFASRWGVRHDGGSGATVWADVEW